MKKLKNQLYLKDISEVNESDVSDIHTLEEGWFVEFKSIAPDNIKVAKSISSFANAYGGVLLFGVTENQKTRTVKSIEGMNKKEADDLIVKVRQAVDAHVTPCPYYDIKSIPIGYDKDECERFIVWTKIPKGDNGPYLHSSGTIYTRKGDSASPMPLTDIGLLERLWSHNKSKRMKTKNRIEYLHSLLPVALPKIEIFIIEEESYNDDETQIEFEEFKALSIEKFNTNTSSNYNIAYSLDNSYIAQNFESGNSIGNINIIWDYDKSMSLHHITIPLATRVWSGKYFENSHLSSNDYKKLEEYLIQKKFTSETLVIDMSFCLAIISKAITKVHKLTEKYRAGRELLVNFKITGVKNSIATLDFDKFYEELNNNTIPIISRDPDFKYPLEDQNKWMRLDFEGLIDHLNDDVFALDISNSMAIFINLCHSIGISHYATIGARGDETDPEEIASLLGKLLTTTHRFNCSTNPSYKI